jgi:hypothetical protein
MAEQANPDGGKHDTTDYSASKAPDNRAAVESRLAGDDARLTPGGAHGSPEEIGMSAMDRRAVPSEALPPDELDVRERDSGR